MSVGTAWAEARESTVETRTANSAGVRGSVGEVLVLAAGREMLQPGVQVTGGHRSLFVGGSLLDAPSTHLHLQWVNKKKEVSVVNLTSHVLLQRFCVRLMVRPCPLTQGLYGLSSHCQKQSSYVRYTAGVGSHAALSTEPRPRVGSGRLRLTGQATIVAVGRSTSNTAV